MKKEKYYYHKLSNGKYAIVEKETGIVLGYTYLRGVSKEELTKDLESFILDDNGCINGDDVAGLKDEPDFIDLLFDERYNIGD